MTALFQTSIREVASYENVKNGEKWVAQRMRRKKG